MFVCVYIQSSFFDSQPSSLRHHYIIMKQSDNWLIIMFLISSCLVYTWVRFVGVVTFLRPSSGGW